jgi:hypothetical protein
VHGDYKCMSSARIAAAPCAGRERQQTICAPCYLFTRESDVNTLRALRAKSPGATTARGRRAAPGGARGHGCARRGESPRCPRAPPPPRRGAPGRGRGRARREIRAMHVGEL